MKSKCLNNVFIFLVFFLSGKAQNESLNHKKYYYYKTRLQNDFMKVGLLPGESLPFNERGNQSWDIMHPDNAGLTYLTSGLGTDQMRAGDCSARLGIYLTALAMEYRLLKMNGQDVSRVKHELFCGLSAINRLDFVAEQIIFNHPNPGNPKTLVPAGLNGFFVRDDIPVDFIANNYEHFNYNNSGLDNTGAPISQSTDFGFAPTFPNAVNGPKGQLVTESNHTAFIKDLDPTKNWNDENSPKKKGVIHGFEASQDQVYYLLMGCAMIKEMVDPGDTDNGATFGFGAGGTSIRQQAIDIAERLAGRFKNDPAYNYRNPANNNDIVQTGGLSAVAAYAIDNAGAFIKEFGNGADFTSNDMPNIFASTGIFFSLGTGISYPKNANTDFRNVVSSTSGDIWNLYMASEFSNNLNNNGIFSVLASICNCFWESKVVKDIDIENQIGGLATTLTNLQNQLSNTPTWLTPVIVVLNIAINTLNAVIQNLFNNLFPSIIFNATDQKLTKFTTTTPFTFNDCTPPSGNQQLHLGSELIMPVYIRDILHRNNGHPAVPSKYLSYITPFGHDQLKNILQNVINTAPCSGNFYLFPFVPGPNWGASNRCDVTDGLWRQGCNDPKGEFAGTDYMLLHNLFYLREGFTIGTQDFSFRKATTSFPIGSNFTNTNIKTFGAYENITATNILNSNAGAIYRAGKEIALLPNGSGGFEVNLGADFAAVINPFHGTCGNPDMGKGSNNNDEMYDEPLNYVGSVSTKNPYSEKAPEYTGVESISVDLLNSQLDSLMRIGTDNVNFIHNKIEVYPTVNTGEFNIMFNLRNTDNVNFEIQDMVGKVVFSAKFITGELSMPVNLKGMAPGVYNIKFTGNESVTCIKRITIIN
ncbi:MAG: T9SS type A sorting domain-containing protein [Bacteroidetes bacterium]|nr:T9SS type A sorting domain-containing protein [Bacteroidota bacterium]MCA6443802.1 T9SS type A sorting domain-containing protein [Bacteroidota bacterium]